jgi:type IV pilus assembly protein PilA
MIKVNRNSKGFTLIELLIVIAIIGILAAIAIPAYTGYTKKSKMSGVTSGLGALKNAIIAYYTETGSIPATVANADIGTTFGVNLPYQYMSTADVAYTSTTGVVIINAGQNIEGTDPVTLTSGDIRTAGAKWTFDSTNTSVKALLPKN